MNLFRSRALDDPASDAELRKDDYVDGQRDAQAADRSVLHERNTAVRQAYDRGRRDERARRPRRRGAPLLTFIVLLAAAAGAGAIYLGVEQGSFSRGGQVVDQKIQSVTQPASQASRSVADRTGAALENAGQRIKRSAGSGG